MLLKHGLLGSGQAVILQPRRLAARLLASRVAQELGVDLGREVGYQIRFENATSDATRIKFETEGILLRQLIENPTFRGLQAVIFDEFHERSLDGDLGLALCLDVQRGLRDDLKILVMSATLDAAKIATYLGAMVIDAPGRLFPVETRYLEKAQRQTVSQDAARAIFRALDETDKNILVFLPGEAEIRRDGRGAAPLICRVEPPRP